MPGSTQGINSFGIAPPVIWLIDVYKRQALGKLAEEDPTFKAYTDEETGQTIIAGMGELHRESIVDRLLREFKVEATVGKPQVTYKATSRKTVKAEGRFVRQTGGHGQYGHCWVGFLRTNPARATNLNPASSAA